MKKLTYILFLSLFTIPYSPASVPVLGFTDGVQEYYATADSATVSEDGSMLYFHRAEAVATRALMDVEALRFGEAESVPEAVTITWEGDTVYVHNPFALDSVRVWVEERTHVYARIESETFETSFVLAGESADGSFKLYSTRKYRLTLDNLKLIHPTGAAINIQTGKKGTIILPEGSVSVLSDGEVYTDTVPGEDQKGCFFSEGQLIFTGEGTLQVSSLSKHAIASDDYLRVESGRIEVTGAGKDAMHGKDSVIIAGGTTILNATGDGIDTDNAVWLRGGSLSINVTGPDVKGISADTLLVISGTTTNIVTSGNGDKGIKTKGNMFVQGGTTTINQTGAVYHYINDEGEADTAKVIGIKVDGNLTITDGRVTVINMATDGKSIKCDGTYTKTGGIVSVYPAVE